MKLKKLAVLAGTMMMLSAFSMNASAMLIDNDHPVTSYSQATNEDLAIDENRTFTITRTGSFNSVVNLSI